MYGQTVRAEVKYEPVNFATVAASAFFKQSTPLVTMLGFKTIPSSSTPALFKDSNTR
jgi:hypothetical protein